MARLIPDYMPDDTPPGERAVFNRLRSAPDDWTVIHSLDLAPRNRSRRTEIDFVVVMPQSGILCVEVKSHREIRFDGNRWWPNTIKKSPFKQAEDGAKTFHRLLGDLAPRFGGVPVTRCCIFSHAPFEMRENMEVRDFELVDGRAFAGLDTGARLAERLDNILARGIDEDPALNRLGAPLDREAVEAIVKCALPLSKLPPGGREQVRARERRVEAALREQQKPVLVLAEHNDRLLVDGPAGTGKTVIAVELARRLADQGRRVGFVCFNQLAGEWAEEELRRTDRNRPQLIAGTAHAVLRRLCEIQVPQDAGPEFWNEEFPEAVENRIADSGFRVDVEFDHLVLDEMQDLLARPRLLECLEWFLPGGFREGRWACFGDFRFQNLVNGTNDVQDGLASLRSTGRPVEFPLRENCRNYLNVGETAADLSGFGRNIYSGFRRDGGGPDTFDVEFYANPEDQVAVLKSWLQFFRQERGFEARDITVLSFVNEQNCAAARLAGEGVQLQRVGRRGGGGYTSIHRFKGLENKVVIVTDARLADGLAARDLLYTALTRALESARLLCHEDSKDTVLQWMREAGREDA